MTSDTFDPPHARPLTIAEGHPSASECGSTVVFRMKGRMPLGRDSRGIARELVHERCAEPVLNPRGPLSKTNRRNDPLRGLYVVPAVNYMQARGILGQLREDELVETAYIAPPRYPLMSRTMMIGGGSGTCGVNWQALINLHAAQKLPQWTGTHRVDVAVVDTGADCESPAAVACHDYRSSRRRQ